ncbi:hypothetical protein LZL87_006460 [Fusarium oxysporum]|nr:hypothetical protein LZL87_006460 [Fusarium oxysporum]
MRLMLILSALQGAALAQKDETHTREYCETRMSRTPATDAHTVTIHTKVEVTATIPRCLKKKKHETYTITLGPVTTTIVTRFIYTALVTAPQKIKTLTITKTRTDTDVMTPTFMKTDTTVYTSTSTLTSTLTVPTVSGSPLASASGYVSRKRSLSKRTLPRRNAWEDIAHVFPPRVFPRKVKLKKLKGPCTIKIDPDDKKHPVEPAQFRGMVACYNTLQITKTTDVKKHEFTRGFITSTVTEADTTVTADDTTTTTSTLTKATTTKTTTETETDLAPAESSWAACNADNLVNSANGGHGINAVNLGMNSYNILPLLTAYDCCVRCHQKRKCIFSVAYHDACYHVIGTGCLPEHAFGTNFTTFGKLLPKDGPTLSNGPCGHIQNAGDSG